MPVHRSVPLVPSAVFTTCVAAGLFAAPAGPALAQDTGGTAVPNPIVVTAPDSYKSDHNDIAKLTQSILDTPQTIEVTTRQVMDDRGATSLTDVFRNSSGITLGAGESSWQGNNIYLRGFSARNDMYIDGMRDFGSYTRDPFNLESVEVLEGPSSMLFGRGSTGGIVDQVSKAPSLQPHAELDMTLGTDDTARITGDDDFAVPALGSGAAMRINVMDDTSGTADRDVVKNRRSGFAPSLALGLGSDNRLTLSYFHQSENDIPDYGIPWLDGKPAPVARNNFYGFSSDYLNTDVDIATVKYEHDFSSNLTLRDQARYGDYRRDWRDTEPQIAAAPAGTPLSDLVVNRALQGGHSQETFLQNQMDLTAHFTTGTIEHTLVTGWEIGPESSKPTYLNAVGLPTTNLLDPDENQVFAGTVFPRVRVSTTAFSVGAYVIDTMKFGPHWELTGGVRWDRFDSHYDAQNYSTVAGNYGQPTTSVTFHEVDQEPSWRLGLVYKPVANGSIYADYSTSFNPSAESLSQIVAVRSLNQGNIGLPPEKNDTFELGTKWNLLSDALQASASVFDIDKTNARIPDPTRPGFNMLGGEQRVDGSELQLVGQITPAWRASVSYTYLDGRQVKTDAGGPPLGVALVNAPRDNIALWTVYRLSSRLEIGAGANSVSRRYGQDTLPLEIAPGYTVANAMVKWRINDNVRLQLNVDNLGNTYYYDELHGFHIIPGPGRTALLTLALTR